jgi:hypothetical protein
LRAARSGITSATFCTTVSVSNSAKCWNTMPMPNRRAAAGEATATGLPFQRISPSSGATAP